uniref:Uncharacterized protein n=1 Tax=Athene cunicularia TaxID=194338 RepID=A0A663MBV6_ATHCN
MSCWIKCPCVACSLIPGKPIFSVDIHPDGTKFATGGQGICSLNPQWWDGAEIQRSSKSEKTCGLR